MRALLWLALIAAPVAAGAQDGKQTPDGAQRFLALTVENHQLQVEAPHPNDLNFVHYRATRAGPGDDRCATRFEALVQDYADKGRRSQFSEAQRGAVDRIVRTHGLATPPFVIDWSSAQIRYDTSQPNNAAFRIRSRNGAVNLWLTPNDPALEKRLHYAMTFLKEACDKTAETGF